MIFFFLRFFLLSHASHICCIYTWAQVNHTQSISHRNPKCVPFAVLSLIHIVVQYICFRLFSLVLIRIVATVDVFFLFFFFVAIMSFEWIAFETFRILLCTKLKMDVLWPNSHLLWKRCFNLTFAQNERMPTIQKSLVFVRVRQSILAKDFFFFNWLCSRCWRNENVFVIWTEKCIRFHFARKIQKCWF